MILPSTDILVLIAISLTALTLLIFIISLFIKKGKKRKTLLDSLNRKLFKIRFPKPTDNEKYMEEISKFEQFISVIASSGQVTLEIVSKQDKEALEFYIITEKNYSDAITKQIYANFPECEITESKDYTIFKSGNENSIGIMKFTNAWFLPIRTYETSKVDTFANVLNSFMNIKQDEGAVFQLVIKPASKSLNKEIISILNKIKKGKSTRRVLYEQKHPILSEFKSLFSNSKEDKPGDPKLIELVQNKITKPLFLVDMRVIVSSSNKQRSSQILNSAELAFQSFGTAENNNFEFKNKIKAKRVMYNFIFRNFFRKNALVMNSEEIASVFHFPTSKNKVENIDWLLAKKVSGGVSNIPSDKTETPEQIDNEPSSVFREGYLHIGNTAFRGQEKPFYLDKESRRRHFYSIGQTGTGKSALMKYLAYQDMIMGNGICVIDPNGDLVEDLLGVIPKERYDDVILFDPSNLERPLGLNMLEYNSEKPEEKTFIVNEIQSIFNRLFSAETMGPMFEQYMRNTLLLLMEDIRNDIPTLIDVPKLLTDSNFRNKKLSNSSNSIINDFWKREVSSVEGDASLSNITPYITSKFNGFIANDYIRPVIGQPKTTLNFRNIMDNKKILLVKLPKGRLGEINANLLGMMVIGKLMLSAFGRDEIPQEQRQDFYCYIDEFQNFTTDTIATILSEARKYRLNLNITHQYISQLSDPIKNAVFGNVGNIASFRIGPEDSEFMSKQFNEIIEPKDLINFANLNGVVKILEDGQPVPPFSFKILFAPRGDVSVASEITKLSRSKYGVPLEEVEGYIRSRSV